MRVQTTPGCRRRPAADDEQLPGEQLPPHHFEGTLCLHHWYTSIQIIKIVKIA